MFIVSLVCLISGAALITTSNPGDVFPIAVGAPISLSGILIFIIAMISKSEQKTLTKKEIQEWNPNLSKLPDAGKVMYRVDVTLDKPITTTVLCGSCGKLSKIEGPKPISFQCKYCNLILWEDEEE